MMLFRSKKRQFTCVVGLIFAVLVLHFCTFPHVKYYYSAADDGTTLIIHNSNGTHDQPCSVIVEQLGTSQTSLFFKLCKIILKHNIVKDKALIKDALNKWHFLLARYVFRNLRKSKQEVSNGLDHSSLMNTSHGQDLWNEYLYTVNTLFYPIKQPARHSPETFYDALDYVIGVCEKFNITCMMLYGTLVGSWRHHSITPWDSDVDVGIIPLNNTLLWLTKFLMRQEFLTSNKYYFQFDHKRKYFVRVICVHNKCVDKSRIIDLYFLTVNSTHVTEEVTSRIHDISDILPTKLRPMGNRMIPSPHNTYRYLQQVYPVHGFKDCDWTECWDIKHVCGFVYRVPILDHSVEVVIGNFTILHVSVTSDNISAPPFVMNMTKGKSTKHVENVGMRVYTSALNDF